MISLGNFWKKFLGWLAICCLCGSLEILSTRHEFLASFFDEIENRSWDWRMKLQTLKAAPDPGIKIILIDQISLDIRERDFITWPWPRSMYVPVVKYLEQAGAKGVAFDLLFTEASYVGPNEDRELADATAGALPVVSAMMFRNSGKGPGNEKFLKFRNRQAERDQETGFSRKYLPADLTKRFRSALLPTMELLEKSHAFGNVAADPDSDGIFRHYIPGGYADGVPALGLPFALYDLVVGREGRTLDYAKLLDGNRFLTVNFKGAETAYKTFSIDSVINSFVDVMESRPPTIPLEEFKDAWVFVGVGAPGLMDLRPTPICDRCIGVFYNATVLDNLLHDDFIARLPHSWSFLFALALVMAGSGLTLIATKLRHYLGATVLLLGSSLGLALWLAGQGYWINVVVPMLCMIISVLLGLGFQYQLEGRQHRFIKSAFQYYVSPGVIDKIIDDPSKLSLGGERRELSIFFSDIVGFTSISETIEPSRLVQLLNTYLTAITDIIMNHGGTVDKYVGDAVVAFWNAPIPVADHASKSVQAALACQAELSKLQMQFESDFGVTVKTRIGINTDPVSVGNFGSKSRFNYTVIGDGANLASRLEGANKFFGTSILISSNTYQQLRDTIRCRKVADIRVVGKSEVVTVYEPLDSTKSGEFKGLDEYERSLSHFEKGDLKSASSGFRSLEEDPLAKAYLRRIEMELKILERDEGAEWSPVWNLTEK